MTANEQYRQEQRLRWQDCQRKLYPEPKRKGRSYPWIYKSFIYLTVFELFLIWTSFVLISWLLVKANCNKVAAVTIVPATYLLRAFAGWCFLHYRNYDRATLAYKLANKHPKLLVGKVANIQYKVYTNV